MLLVHHSKNDNIDRIIKKASADDANYEVIYYEGYGPSGVAVIVEATTDNRNRTSAEVRHYFDKFGGNMGTIGCVSYLFSYLLFYAIYFLGVIQTKL